MKNISIIIMTTILSGALALLSSCSRSESAVNPRCEELEKRFDRILAAADGSCSADVDCACYGQSTSGSKCGGMTDRKTAAAIEPIAKEFRALNCPRNYRCDPWKCVPACFKSKCVTDLLKKTMEKKPVR
jgi:hypothetical protein